MIADATLDREPKRGNYVRERTTTQFTNGSFRGAENKLFGELMRLVVAHMATCSERGARGIPLTLETYILEIQPCEGSHNQADVRSPSRDGLGNPSHS